MKMVVPFMYLINDLWLKEQADKELCDKIILSVPHVSNC